MTLKKLLLLTCMMMLTLTHFAQEEDESMGPMESSAKMIEAKHEYNNNNMRGALTLYREVLESEPENYAAMYWSAKCHYELKKYDLAKNYIEQSIAIAPNKYKDIELFRGMIEHRLANLDQAITHFEQFIENKSKKAYIPEAEEYIRQCKFAKRMMDNPADVVVKNMGSKVNSRYDDYTPSINAKGDLLLFTSRRADTKGGAIDEKGDYKFYEDIYFSRLVDGEWTRSEGVKGSVNTNRYDAVLSVSPSGDQMYVYKNNQNSAGDIFTSNYKSVTETWSEPEKLPKQINTSYFETSASITANGKTMYFVSERPDGKGSGDIYRVDKKDNGEWGTAKNLGAVINTEMDEKFVFIHPNGKTLFFASDGHQTMGSYDLFKTEYVNGQWSFPINLGYPINTVNEESTFSLTRDNQNLLIAAEYDDSMGERDLYIIDVSQYPLLSSGYDKTAYGTVKYRIIDEKGKGVRGAKVEFFYLDSETVLKTMKTDKDGLVSINLPLNASYTIKVYQGKDNFNMDDFVLPESNDQNQVLEYDLRVE